MDGVQEQVSIGVTNLSKKYVELLNYLRVVVDEPGGFGRKDNLDKACFRVRLKVMYIKTCLRVSQKGKYSGIGCTE